MSDENIFILNSFTTNFSPSGITSRFPHATASQVIMASTFGRVALISTMSLSSSLSLKGSIWIGESKKVMDHEQRPLEKVGGGQKGK